MDDNDLLPKKVNIVALNQQAQMRASVRTKLGAGRGFEPLTLNHNNLMIIEDSQEEMSFDQNNRLNSGSRFNSPS
jgi:hypothetical protein